MCAAMIRAALPVARHAISSPAPHRGHVLPVAGSALVLLLAAMLVTPKYAGKF